MQILNMTKINKTLFKSDAHTCIDQQASWEN